MVLGMGGGGQANYFSDPKKNQAIQDEVNLRNSIKINNGEAGLDQYLDGYNDAAKEGFYAKLNPSNWLKSKEEIFQEAMNEIKDKPEAYKIGYAKIFAETYGLPEKVLLNGAILGATGYIGVKGLTGASTENKVLNSNASKADDVTKIVNKADESLNLKVITDSDTAKIMVDKFKNNANTREIINRQTGEVVGEITKDGSKVIRSPHVDNTNPQLHWNLEDKNSGKNIHILLEDKK